jgi:putative OPT family oligopeptide transporter
MSKSTSSPAIQPPDPAADSSSFHPFIPPEASVREFTVLPVILGTLLGMVFGASSLYLVLKVGMTVSASIPVAVISITMFRMMRGMGMRSATVLENNIVQTAGSAGESIAFGLGVTMPAILILGFDLEVLRITLVAVLGGLLGILMMIPLRRALIVQQHGILKYPEGTACAEILKAAARAEWHAAAGASSNGKSRTLNATVIGAKTIFTGFGMGLAYKALMMAFKGWKDVPEKVFGAPFKAGSVAAEISPELLGVGYVIGPRLSAIMCGGGVLAYLVLIPMIRFFGEGLAAPLAPGTMPISEMGPNDIRGAYVLYIGAGAVAAGGIISLFRSLPIILQSLRGGLRLVGAGRLAGRTIPRTERDLPLKTVLIGILVLMTAIVLSRPLQMNVLGAALIVLFGFLFATVSSRLTGEIGSSSNPISGMTVATLLLTCLVFLTLGWTQPPYYVTALSVGAIVCIASSNAGTTSQDLKTGFLVGATPRLQQIAILIGTLGSALILGPILLELNQAATVYVPPTTYEKVIEKSVVLPPISTAALPPQPDVPGLPAGGPYRICQVEVSSGKDAAPPLDPGVYLVDNQGAVKWRVRKNFADDLHAVAGEVGGQDKLKGPQAEKDPTGYRVWHKTNTDGSPAGKYLVNEQAQAVYLVDPGINGVHRQRPDGSEVRKFDAPKATLISYIIKGILSKELPWGLVLLGVMIAVVLEMAGIPSLTFAVGVYLPLSSTTPILAGGLVRWLVDVYLRNKHCQERLTEEQLQAEGDKSHGVLMASGYIAGGALAGIIIAFMAGLLTGFNDRITQWSTQYNPFFDGRYADGLSLLPFLVLVVILYLTGREVLFRPRSATTRATESGPRPPHAPGGHGG